MTESKFVLAKDGTMSSRYLGRWWIMRKWERMMRSISLPKSKSITRRDLLWRLQVVIRNDPCYPCRPAGIWKWSLNWASWFRRPAILRLIEMHVIMPPQTANVANSVVLLIECLMPYHRQKMSNEMIQWRVANEESQFQDMCHLQNGTSYSTINCCIPLLRRMELGSSRRYPLNCAIVQRT